MRKWSQYKIKYEPEWEKDSLLKDWLQSIPGDSRNARCGVCQVVLPAHHAGLCRHAQDPKHVKRIAEGNLSSKSQSHSVDHGTMSNKDNCVKSDGSSITIVKQEVPDSFQLHALFSDWVRPSPDDVTKAHCHLCNVDLEAEFQCLDDHANTQLHQQQRSSTRTEEESPTPDMIIVKSDAVSSISNSNLLESAESNEASDRTVPLLATNFKVKPVKLKCSTEGNAVVDGFSVHSITTALSRGESQLELVCENDDEYQTGQSARKTHVRGLVQSRNAPKSSSSAYISNAVSISSSTTAVSEELAHVRNESESLVDRHSTATRNKRLAEQSGNEPPTKVTKPAVKKFDIEWLNLPMFQEWLEEHVQDKSRAWCRACQCPLSASVVHLQRHAMSFRHVRCMQPLDDNGTAAVFLTKNNELKTVDSSTVDEFEDINNRRALSEEDGEHLSDDVIDGRRKRKSKDGTKWSKYKKMYRREWESDPLLEGWIAPVAGDRFKAACKYCCCILRAHYSDLRHHSSSAKHGKNEGWHKSGGSLTAEKPIYFKQATRKGNESSGIASSSHHGTSSGCYVVQMSTWSKYRKRYSKQWEQDPLLRGWIMPVPGDDSRARCRYCRLLLRAHYSDLRNHARTTKHASNVAFGRPCTDVSQTAGRTANKTSMLSMRKKKHDAVDLTDDLLILDRPDDSLASIKSLTNLAQFGWDDPQGPETTLILHNGMHLDERLAASLPQTPGLRFRVKKETTSTGYEQQASVIGKKRKDRTAMSSSSFVSTEEISDEMLKHLARSVTLWEFLMLKVSRGRPGTDRRLRIADILTEFSELQKKVKHISWQALSPALETTETSDDVHDGEQTKKTKKTLMLESKDLAQCLGLSTGRYEINQSAELAESSLVNCRPLIPPLRRRTKVAHREATSAAASFATVPSTVHEFGTQSFEMIDGSELRQYVIDPTDAETQSLLQGHILDGTGQQLVLVAADSGELLLQCDLKDYQTMMQNRSGSSLGVGYTTLDDLRSLVSLQTVETPVVMTTTSAEAEFEG